LWVSKGCTDIDINYVSGRSIDTCLEYYALESLSLSILTPKQGLLFRQERAYPQTGRPDVFDEAVSKTESTAVFE
jgi:hypothetical protein